MVIGRVPPKIEAIILIVVRPGMEEEVYSKLSSSKGVREAYRVYGEYDVILRVEFDDIGGLNEFHDTVLRSVEGIELTETLIAGAYVTKE